MHVTFAFFKHKISAISPFITNLLIVFVIPFFQ